MNRPRKKLTQKYVKDLLREHGCTLDCYHDIDLSTTINDLKTAYPDGMDYPYEDVAKMLILVGQKNYKKPTPPKYRVVWYTDSCIDGFGCKSLSQAKASAIDILITWMTECRCDNADEEDWNYMIDTCFVSVFRKNDADEYDEIWTPSERMLKNIGWTERT